jgi:PKD repeat protein
MKKTILLLSLVTLFAESLLPNIITNPKSRISYVGDQMAFRLDCSEGAQVSWNWGDGQQQVESASLDWRYHYYRNPGVYEVHTHRFNFDATPSCTPMYDDYTTVTILEDRSITAVPGNPLVNFPVTFTAINFNTPANITWDLGDGTTLYKQGINVTHTYAATGTYVIKAYDWGDIYRTSQATPVTLTLTISTDNRRIAAAPASPQAGQKVTLTATSFLTPSDISWDLGDGTTFLHKGSVITHAYQNAGTYTVRAFDQNGDVTTVPITLTLVVLEPPRIINYSPGSPRVDQQVEMQALNFRSSRIDWDFGDGISRLSSPTTVRHRYASAGSFTIAARESGLDVAPITRIITILPENRSLSLSAAEVMKDEILTVTALNFRGQLILWDFGDGTVVSGPATMTHSYKFPGIYIITARDENGVSEKIFQVSVQILGITDQVNLEIAELTLDNGKYYKVVPKNSRSIRAQLRMKMRGTGIVSGYWIVDERPYQFFNETAFQGQVNTIVTSEIPGLPVLDPGMHTVTVQLARPASAGVVFPTLRYFVLPYENAIETLVPKDGAVLKEDKIAQFSWEKALGGSYYQIAFSNSLFPLLRNDTNLKWLDCPDRFTFTPDAETWNAIQRNQWTYWKVRALDSSTNVVGESPVQEIKIIVPGVEIGFEKLTDIDGNPIAIGSDITSTRADTVLVHGHISYPAEADYLILRVYAGDDLIDQLLFRDVKKDETRSFETSVPCTEKEGRVVFLALKSSSPSVVIGYSELKLIKQ